MTTIHDIIELFKEVRKNNDEEKLHQAFKKLMEIRNGFSIVNVGRCKDVTDAARRIINENFIVRLYDGFDNEWIDVSKPVLYEEALKIWCEKTSDGTEKTHFNHIDYYAIYSEDIVMHYSLKGMKQK